MGGFNTRVDYRGSSFIVQTQDKGPAVPYVESLVYKSGRLLASKRSSYAAFLEAPEVKDRIERLMEEQHNAILDQIVVGRYD